MIESDASVGSYHYPVAYVVHLKVERIQQPRRITKTLLQSKVLAETAETYYPVALRKIDEKIIEARAESEVETRVALDMMEKEIKLPWASQANKHRRHAPPHWNDNFIKLLVHKKLLYDRMKWNGNRRNTCYYKEACKATQRYERQLKRERNRKNKQMIQNNPEAEIAVVLRKQADTLKKQEALGKLTVQQINPQTYGMYMRRNLDIPNGEDIELERFEMDVANIAKLIEKAIHKMDRNKAAGEDNIHIEMMKSNAPVVAITLSKGWKLIGKSKIAPKCSLRGTIVRLFKGKDNGRSEKLSPTMYS